MDPTASLLVPELRELLAESRFRDLRDALRGMDPHDVALILEELETPEAAMAFRLLPRDESADVFSHFEPEFQQAILDAMGSGRALRVLEDMSDDDRVNLLDELPSEVSKELIRLLRPETRRTTQQILGYPEDSVGRLMTTDYVRLRPSWTVAQALEHIRRFGKDAETLHWVYVIDAEYRLIDDLHIRKLLIADLDTPISELMDDRYLALNATDDQEEAVRIMADYDRSALPVIDSRGILLGIVTYDDVVDIAEIEATEDIHKLGGVEALEAPYTSTSLATMLKKRGGWLAGLFVFQVCTIGVMSFFGGQLEKAVVLALFIPLIISAGGNTGTQAASLLVRALALREVEPNMWKRVLAKELATGLALGAGLAVLGYLVVVVLHHAGIAANEHYHRIGITVGVATLGIVVWAVVIGSMFPLLLERLKLDPATISSPLVATLMDVSGILIYFTATLVILSGTVL